MLMYLMVGMVICGIGQVVFWFEIGGRGIEAYPAIWAYFQEAMARAMVGDNVVAEVIVWGSAYIAIGVVSGWLLEWGKERTLRVAVSRAMLFWMIAQCAITGAGVLLLWVGVLEME